MKLLKSNVTWGQFGLIYLSSSTDISLRDCLGELMKTAYAIFFLKTAYFHKFINSLI